MSIAYIYTKPDCEACVIAQKLVEDSGYQISKIDITQDPLAELGIKLLTEKNEVTVPMVVVVDEGIYILSMNEPRQLMRIVNLEIKGEK